MNKKGFTLIELLAVILILSGISIVAVVSISSSLDRRNTKACEELLVTTKNAAKIFFSLNGYTDDGVTLKCLMGRNYNNWGSLCAQETYLEENQVSGYFDYVKDLENTDHEDIAVKLENIVVKLDQNKTEYKVYVKGEELKCPQS